MNLGWWMLVGSVLSSLVATILIGAEAPAVRLAVWLGMIGPLVAALSTWVAVERMFRKQPEKVTGVLIKAFVLKLIFFGGYVAVILKGTGVRPVPFVISFASYFLALHITEAVRLKRLFAPG